MEKKTALYCTKWRKINPFTAQNGKFFCSVLHKMESFLPSVLHKMEKFVWEIGVFCGSISCPDTIKGQFLRFLFVYGHWPIVAFAPLSESEKRKIMIEYIKGEITEITPATVTLETSGGVGYLLNISLNTYTAIQNKTQVRLYVYEAIREDAWVLFGFASKEERELFLQLITVSGIGGNTARMILSALSPRELCDVIATGNDKLLKTVKGIGLKTAQRIIVDLKDKIKLLPSVAGVATGGELPLGGVGQASAVMEEAVSALTMLGFPAAASQKVVMGILKEEPSAPVEKVIKVALKRL